MNPHAHWENVGRGLGLLELLESHDPCIIWYKETRDYINYQQETYRPSRKGGHWPPDLMPIPVSHFHPRPFHPPYPEMHILAAATTSTRRCFRPHDTRRRLPDIDKLVLVIITMGRLIPTLSQTNKYPLL